MTFRNFWLLFSAGCLMRWIKQFADDRSGVSFCGNISQFINILGGIMLCVILEGYKVCDLRNHCPFCAGFMIAELPLIEIRHHTI